MGPSNAAFDFFGLLVRKPMRTTFLGFHLEQDLRGILLLLLGPKFDSSDQFLQLLFHRSKL